MGGVLIHKNNHGFIIKVENENLEKLDIYTYKLTIPVFKYNELLLSSLHKSNNGDIGITNIIDITDNYWLPIDISDRLKHLRTHGSNDPSYNKTAMHTMFAIDKLDILSHDEIVDVLMGRWSQNRLFWLFKLLEYPIHIYYSAILNFRYITCNVMGNPSDSKFLTILNSIVLDNDAVIPELTEYIKEG